MTIKAFLFQFKNTIQINLSIFHLCWVGIFFCFERELVLAHFTNAYSDVRLLRYGYTRSRSSHVISMPLIWIFNFFLNDKKNEFTSESEDNSLISQNVANPFKSISFPIIHFKHFSENSFVFICFKHNRSTLFFIDFKSFING